MMMMRRHNNLLHLEGWMVGTGAIAAIGHIGAVNDHLGKTLVGPLEQHRQTLAVG